MFSEMAGVRLVVFPEQQHPRDREATVAVNVVTAPTQHETQGVTSRITRTMTRTAELNIAVIYSFRYGSSLDSMPIQL